ncbi:Transposon Ty3-I Gag-Pol polyprotein [Vitis vinifera]|uniref:Transposon Ty3-I Gag-Pol polyprotein n=1 Tax=Vitis vinifera TaxID=29760 RepID=A0A438HS58_VITVI|nr:Transposon Ty3-I Gag-Pol polyprotein [Vitis vinifera]
MSEMEGMLNDPMKSETVNELLCMILKDEVEGFEEDIWRILVEIESRRCAASSLKASKKGTMSISRKERELKDLISTINYDGVARRKIEIGNVDKRKVIGSMVRKLKPNLFKDYEGGFIWVFSGLYGPLKGNKRREKWEELAAMTSAMREFSNFIDEFELVDLPQGGGRVSGGGVVTLGSGGGSHRFVLAKKLQALKINPKKWNKEGDPFSPYLFVLIMEAFNRLIAKVEEGVFIKGVKIEARGGEGVQVSHLLFADDNLLFYEDDEDQLKYWKWIVTCFKFKNTHSFVKDGGRIVLTPLMPKVKDSKVVGNYFLKGSQLKKVLTKQDEIYALLVMDAYATQQAPCHELLLPLLEEFKDMMPDEILIGLPPMRNIQHCIDLVPRATLPNKAVYRMNSFQQAELQKLVDHLIAKGLIRESMNPCTIPTLLVLKKDGSWRMCIDSRAINKITIKYQFPIPRLDDLLDQLYSAKQIFAGPYGAYSLIFLSYVVSGARIKMDPSKVKAIESWLVPKTIHDVRSFHGMEADESFDLVKRKITTVPVLINLDFHKVFEVDCDASNVGIGVVINQEGVNNRVPKCSLREAIIREAHGGGLAGHFDQDKTLIMVQENFYWPKLMQDIQKIVEGCVACHKAKMHWSNTRLYTPPIPTTP